MLDLKRLAIGLPIVAVAVAVTLYLLLPRETDPAVRSASIVDTPGAPGRKLGLQPGELAPNFEASTHDGGRVRLSDFRGRPVLINFWARWCASCLAEMPEIKALQAERSADGFVVIAVNAGETRAQAVEFIDFLNAPFTFALDPGLRLSDAYGVRGLPQSVFIDAAGVVQATYAGHADRARLTAYMDAAAKAQPPATLPLQLRPVSEIPRDNVLEVARKGDTLTLRSRSLRCDFTYCADKVTDALKPLAGIKDARFDTSRDGDGILVLRIDPGVITQEDAIKGVLNAIAGLNDPVYTKPPEVKLN
jgi:peroxiredoxin